MVIFVISLILFHFTCIVYNLLCLSFLLNDYFVSVVKELCQERMSEEDLYKLLIPKLFEVRIYICSTFYNFIFSLMILLLTSYNANLLC